MPNRLPHVLGIVLAAALVSASAACSSDDEPDTPPQSGNVPTTEAPTTTEADSATSGSGSGADLIVFSTEGNNLNAYDPEPPFEKQTVITNAEDDPDDGMDINAQICFFPDDPHLFIAGEDTGQPERTPGWGIFEVEGDTVGSLSASQVARLVPTYQPGDNPENYGCGVLSDGRVVTTDIGNEVDGTPSGQLIVWFPPFDSEEVPFCKIDVALPTPGGIHVVDDVVYLATARPPDNGIVRYEGPFPTSADASGGCGQLDATGAPLADAVRRSVFIPADDHVVTPNAVVGAPGGGFYVSSAFTGVLAEYDDSGRFVRTLVAPAAGEELGAEPYSTGAPFGMGVDPTTGTLYWADLAIGITDSIGPIDGAGTVRRITFEANGEPRPADTLDEGLDFPDGIGIYVPTDG